MNRVRGLTDEWDTIGEPGTVIGEGVVLRGKET